MQKRSWVKKRDETTKKWALRVGLTMQDINRAEEHHEFYMALFEAIHKRLKPDTILNKENIARIKGEAYAEAKLGQR